MARIREQLRHARLPATSQPVPPEIHDRAEAEVEIEVKSAEAISFIEVGARRYFEASADVLASMPSHAGKAVEGSSAGLPRPHNVLLRSLSADAVVPVAAPTRRLAPELVAYHAPGQPASARYSDLLAALLEAGQGKAGVPCRALLLTASRPGIGTTTVLLNLAITAARQDRRVVVVDANLRRAALADRLGLPPTPGLTEVLAGEIFLADALQGTAQQNLVLLACGGPAALLADEASVSEVVRQLAVDHDLVLIDGPRIDHSQAGCGWEGRAISLLASVCQALYLVVPATEAGSAATGELTAALSARALPLAGCIVAG